MDRPDQGSQNKTDSDLLARVFREEKGAWEKFWSQHGEYIERIIRRFSLGYHHEDVLQEIAQALILNDYKKLKAWDPERSSLRRYLTVVAVSCTLNYIKSSKFRFQVLKLDSIDSVTGAGDSVGQLVDEFATSPFKRLERIQVMERIKGILDDWVEEEKIRPTDRDIVEYRLRGLTFQEVANVMNLSLSNVLTRFTRMKPKLRKKLENSGILSE